MPLKTIINGIDVDRQRAYGPDGVPSGRPEAAVCTEWMGGTQTRTLVTVGCNAEPARQFAIHSDYPEMLLGSGVASSPLELLVTAVGASFVTSFVVAAAMEDVRIESMRALTETRVTADAMSGASNDETELSELELRAEVDADAPSAVL